MDFNLNDDRRMLSETLHRFLTDQYPIEKRHAATASEEGFSREMWRQFADLGIIGALFSEADGGFGGEGIDISVVFEQLGRALVVEPLLPSAVLAGSVLSSLGDGGQKRIINSLISGQTIAALAHGEPTARYELNHVSTTATEGGESYLLNGNKSVVLAGGCADLLLVSARSSGEIDNENGISVFLVKPDSAGLTMRSFVTNDGYAAAEISLENVAGVLVGQVGKAFAAIEKAHARAIVAISAEALGAMEIAKDQTVEYMQVRKQFGSRIGQFQALQHRMADLLIEIEQLRSAVINAAGNLEADRVTREKCISTAKNFAGSIGRQVAEEAIQIHGGNGMTWEYSVAHYAKHLIMIDHLFGDTDHHLERFIELI